MSKNSGFDFIDIILGFLICAGQHNQKYTEKTTTYRETVDKKGNIVVLKTVVIKERR